MYAGESRCAPAKRGHPLTSACEVFLLLAAIDVGTNSIHLIVVELDASFATWSVVHKARAMVRLGSDDALETGRLDTRAMVRGVEAIERFVHAARTRGAHRVRIVATSAVREAENANDFVRAVAQRVGMPLDVVDEREEARLIYLGVAHGFPIGSRTALIVDIGGGSTELIVADGTRPHLLESLRLGSLRLYDAYFRNNGDQRAAQRELVARVDAMLEPLLEPIRTYSLDLAIGTSGTIMGLAALDMRAAGRNDERTHGYILKRERLVTLQKRMLALDVPARRRMPGMNPRRADIIVAGNALLIRILDRLGLEELVVCERALRDGIIVDMLARDRALSSNGDGARRGRLEAVEAMARHYSAAGVHQRTVAFLALLLFRMLADLHRLPIGDAELLYAAAYLHDIGRFVGDSGYHKHTAYLIRNGRLAGWSPEEVNLIATIARYYRKAMPKPNHPEFASLSPSDRRRVSALAAFLRIADGLDARHLGLIGGLAIERPPGRVHIVAQADQDVSGELEAAAARADLFERTFELPVTFASAAVKELV